MTNSKEVKFEDKMNKLIDIVNKLEKDSVDLDTSLVLYEEGLKLSNELKDELKGFEKKIEEINNKEDE